MSSPVTWYRITNVVVALGLAIAKYIVGSKVDLVSTILTGGVMYVIGWWENDPRLLWYFKTDWETQRQVIRSSWTSCVFAFKNLIISMFADGLFWAFIYMSQSLLIIISLIIRLYYGGNPPLVALHVTGCSTVLFEDLWLFLKKPPFTRSDRVFNGITVVLLFYYSLSVVIRLVIDDTIRMMPYWLIALQTPLAFTGFFFAYFLFIRAVTGRL